LFTFFVNAFLFWLVGAIIPGFYVVGFAAAFFGALVITLVNWLLNLLFDVRRIEVQSRSNRSGRREDVIDLKHKGDGRWE
jgi:putative membrane protein